MNIFLILVTTEGIEEQWVRNCNFNKDHDTLGCSQHQFDHEGHNFTVDVCVCGSDLCNTEMGPIPDTTTTTLPTTTNEGTGF